MSRIALLDVNLLVALFDPDHIHHDLAHDWFSDHHAAGWATCPTTEAGFIRVLSNPAYGAEIRRPVDLVDRLRRFCASRHHTFWPTSPSLRDESIFDVEQVRGYRQVMDISLLGLAVTMGGSLATFDASIPLGAVRGASRHALMVVAPASD